jgi:hypothetical protein
MLATLRVPALILIGSTTLAGCSGGLDAFGGGSSDVTTNTITQAQAPKVDPACGNLAIEIDTLRREGVADKIERAAAGKYKMKKADLTKASQLNKANGEFQSKCSTLPRTAAATDAPAANAAAAATTAASAAATKAAAPAAKAAAARTSAVTANPGAAIAR